MHNNAENSDEYAEQRAALEPIRQSLLDAGYYAYGTPDSENRWCIAVDDERGRVDVRLGPDGYVLELWNHTPGLFFEQESEWRRRAMERLARRVLPAIDRGRLEPHQHAEWNEEEHGVSVRIAYELSFQSAANVAAIAESHFQELNDLLVFVENEVAS